MKRNQKLARSAELLGRKLDYTAKFNAIEKFDTKWKEQESLGDKKHLLELSTWQDIPKSDFLFISELKSKQQELLRRINEKERSIIEVVSETLQLNNYEPVGVSISSEEAIDLLRETVKREEQEMRKELEDLNIQKTSDESDPTQLSTKYEVYQYILPIETSIRCQDPLTIDVSFKSDANAPDRLITFSEADLHSSEKTNKLWDY